MPKSKDAFRTISEVAEWLDAPAHVLRFWESKFTQVKPVKRAGGRRYYRPADMLLLGGIKKLLHDDGLTIKGAQKLLREHGVKHVAALSQVLDEDLIEEAAYELDAQPEPIVEAPATVLSFPSRTEPLPEPEPEPEPEIEAAATQAPVETAEEEPINERVHEPIHQNEPPEPNAINAPTQDTQSPVEANSVEAAPVKVEDESPAFGDSDTLPAFLRRAPSPQTPHQPSMSAPEAPAEDTALEQEVEVTAKLTIDPVARFVPVEEPAASEKDIEPDVQGSDIAASAPEQDAPKPAQPIFSRRAPATLETTTEIAPEIEPAPKAAPEIIRSAQFEQPAIEPAVQPVDATAPLAPVQPPVDVPSIAKIAPELDSYTAPSGVLAALPGTGRIPAALASEMSAHLNELRALRDRMRG